MGYAFGEEGPPNDTSPAYAGCFALVVMVILLLALLVVLSACYSPGSSIYERMAIRVQNATAISQTTNNEVKKGWKK